MLPLFDENPTRRRPIVTWFLILVSVAIHLGAYVGGDAEVSLLAAADTTHQLPDNLRFSLEHAAIPCEITQQRPLSSSEISATYYGSGDPIACDPNASDAPLFPNKPVLAAIISSMFLHGGYLHLGFNMLFLWVFGNNIEDRLGRIGFAVFYLLSGTVATIAYVTIQPSGTVAILGASGAVAGIMGSYLVWFPDAPIRTLVFLVLVDIRARWFLLTWLAIQFLTSVGPRAWMAHMAGFAFGVIAGKIVRKVQPRLRLPSGQVLQRWDATGGAGHGPYPHLDEVWVEPHHEHYE
jgi:membrane associated rhomboid family serine protease